MEMVGHERVLLLTIHGFSIFLTVCSTIDILGTLVILLRVEHVYMYVKVNANFRKSHDNELESS